MRQDNRLRRWAAGLVGLLALTVVAAGCGESDSDEEAVKSTVAGFLEDVADGDGGAGCARLTEAGVREFSSAAFFLQAPATCPEAIKVANGQLSDDQKKALRTAKVNRVTVSGERATVADSDIELDVEGDGSILFLNNDPKPFQLEKSGDSWRIASVG
jgi:hypothetical protein